MQESILKLNLTLIPGCTARHTMVFAAWDDLPVGKHFIIENDHDPIPLRRQLTARAQEGGSELVWDYLQKGPDVYRVQVGRKKAGCGCGCGGHH